MKRLVILLGLVGAGQLLLASGAPRAAQRGGAPCAYATRQDSVSRLLRQIDLAFPGCVQRSCQGEQRQYRAVFETGACFTEDRRVDPPYNLAGPRREDRLRQGFRMGFRKPIGESGTIEVLHYQTTADAARSQLVMDSIVYECRNRENRAEECIGIDLFRSARQGRCIIRFNTYAEDPLRGLAIRQIRSCLYSAL